MGHQHSPKQADVMKKSDWRRKTLLSKKRGIAWASQVIMSNFISSPNDRKRKKNRPYIIHTENAVNRLVLTTYNLTTETKYFPGNLGSLPAWAPSVADQTAVVELRNGGSGRNVEASHTCTPHATATLIYRPLDHLTWRRAAYVRLARPCTAN